jgi:hypothetical protein
MDIARIREAPLAQHGTSPVPRGEPSDGRGENRHQQLDSCRAFVINLGRLLRSDAPSLPSGRGQRTSFQAGDFATSEL